MCCKQHKQISRHGLWQCIKNVTKMCPHRYFMPKCSHYRSHERKVFFRCVRGTILWDLFFGANGDVQNLDGLCVTAEFFWQECFKVPLALWKTIVGKGSSARHNWKKETWQERGAQSIELYFAPKAIIKERKHHVILVCTTCKSNDSCSTLLTNHPDNPPRSKVDQLKAC